MIWFSLARDAEVVSTLVTSHSIGTHVLGGHFVNLFPIIILEAIVDLPLQHFDGVTTFAPDHILILFDHRVDHLGLYILILFLTHYGTHLVIV